MNNQSFISGNLDFLGFFTSSLCALHCAAVPLVLTIGSLKSLTILENPLIEMLALSAGILIALLSLLPSFFKKHHNSLPIKLIGIGIILIVAGHLFAHQLAESILTVIGACTIATAHYFNWKLVRNSKKLTPQGNDKK